MVIHLFWKKVKRIILLVTSFVTVISTASRLGTSSEPTLNTFLLYPPINETDIYIGSLFPIHSANLNGTTLCGELQSEDGILPLETFLFTLDEINENKDLLPGFTLGGLALDSCNSPEVALQQSLRYMK
ncbi:putative metabotropic glutamate receptor mgl-1, partial [Armadillidium vulgare]